jgi:F-type H+-transporting ATPase subunit c
MAVSSAMGAIGRQPEASNKIMTNMIIGCAFIEAITIYVLVFAFMYAGK